MKCKICQNKIEEVDSFCTKCGTKVSVSNRPKNAPTKGKANNIFSISGKENKWWHRFAKTLIYIITILIFGVSIYIFINNTYKWNSPDPSYVFSFENNYGKEIGFTEKCDFTPHNTEDYITIRCGEIGKNHNYNNGAGFLPDFLDRFSKSISYKEEFLSKTEPREVFNKIYYKLEVDYPSLNDAILKGDFENIKAKKTIVLSELLKYLVVLFIPALVAFIILKIIYRLIIYIIYGNN